MRRYLVAILLPLLTIQPASSQGFRARYEAFKNRSTKEYVSFRRACNDRYIEFLLQSWAVCQAQEAIEAPEENWLPPVICEEDPATEPSENKIDIDSVLVIPGEAARPQPLAPFDSQTVSDGSLQFDFFNTKMQVAIPDERFRMTSVGEKEIATLWKELSKPKYDDLLASCLQLREQHHLCDWAYLVMLLTCAEEWLESENEAVLLTAYLLSQSGYQIRLGRSADKLELLVASDYMLLGSNFYSLDGMRYWPVTGSATSLAVVGHDFPGGRPMSFAVSETPQLSWRPSDPRLLTGPYSLMTVSCQVNLNLLGFWGSYPLVAYGDDPMTLWAMHANAPLDQAVKDQIYPSLRRALVGKSLPEAANLLLGFVQSAFDYAEDEKAWGYERPLFTEETLFYPYSDCEDRAILYSRLVRDLLGLEVALVYYPGHLATAVKFPMALPGDFLELEDGRYLICDPTYIGAAIGMSMPDLKQEEAKAILL